MTEKIIYPKPEWYAELFRDTIANLFAGDEPPSKILRATLANDDAENPPWGKVKRNPKSPLIRPAAWFDMKFSDGKSYRVIVKEWEWGLS